jgi:hypothetical protein
VRRRGQVGKLKDSPFPWREELRERWIRSLNLGSIIIYTLSLEIPLPYTVVLSAGCDVKGSAIKSEFLKAEILVICKNYVVILAYGWDLAGVTTGMPPPPAMV